MQKETEKHIKITIFDFSVNQFHFFLSLTHSFNSAMHSYYCRIQYVLCKQNDSIPWTFFYSGNNFLKKRTNFLFTFLWEKYFFVAFFCFVFYSIVQSNIVFILPQCPYHSIYIVQNSETTDQIGKIFKRNVLFTWKINLKKQIKKLQIMRQKISFNWFFIQLFFFF